jgi:hypothetical protein
MDIERILAELRAERERIDGIIEAIERYRQTGKMVAEPRHRGRKFIGPEDRQEVSERMKRYWARRRAEKAHKARTIGAEAGVPAGDANGLDSEMMTLAAAS